MPVGHRLTVVNDPFDLVLVNVHALVTPPDNKKSVQRDAVLAVVDLRDVLDVDAHVYHRLRTGGTRGLHTKSYKSTAKPLGFFLGCVN